MATIMIVLLTLAVGLLGALFYFLHRRVEDMGRRLGNIYANMDVVHKNQEELLAQNLRMFHEQKEKRGKK